MLIDGQSVNPRALFLAATRGTKYEPGARETLMRLDDTTAACRVYAALIGERQIDPEKHKPVKRARKPVVRRIQRRARLDIQDLMEARYA